jgi:hypothetical protein
MKTKLFFLLMGMLVISFPAITVCQGKYMTTKFQEVDSIPSGKALIYIYRPSSFSGSAVHYSVNVNDSAVNRVHLYNGGYFEYFAEPGQNIFTAEVAKESTTAVVNAEAGKIYFVRGTIRTGTWVGRPFMETVDQQTGLKEIQKCKLLKDQ